MTAIQDSLPIDEMLEELRIVLKEFEEHPSHGVLDDIRMETWRIERFCESVLEGFWEKSK